MATSALGGRLGLYVNRDASGPIGPTGPAGARGAAGLRGPAGPAGPASHKFVGIVGVDQPTKTLISLGGVLIDANCASGVENMDIHNNSGTTGARVVTQGVSDQGPFGTGGDFSGTNLTPDNTSHGAGTGSVLFATGTVTTVLFGYDHQPSGACSYWGELITN